jgi:hypothetical protein
MDKIRQNDPKEYRQSDINEQSGFVRPEPEKSRKQIEPYPYFYAFFSKFAAR